MTTGPGAHPAPVRPMLATPGDPPAGPGWAVEFKWDGVRALLAAAGGAVRLWSRNGNDVTAGYPELTAAAAAFATPVLLDGEIVALDAGGRPDFGLLQQRMHVRAPAPELLVRVPTVYFAFDVLERGGRSLLGSSYDERRAALAGFELDSVPGFAVPPAATDVSGAQILEVARAHGLEGVVAKRRSSRYEPGRRSPSWVKTALLTTQEVLVAGWTPGEGRRAGTIGALLLGARDGAGRLRYLGHVGTGFTGAALAELQARLAPLARTASPFDDPVPSPQARKARWVRPELVGEVVYRTLTADLRLRHAAWRGLRPDRDPDEIVVSLPES